MRIHAKFVISMKEYSSLAWEERMMTSMDVIATSLLRMSESIASIGINASKLHDGWMCMEQMLIEMKKMNEQLRKLNKEDAD